VRVPGGSRQDFKHRQTFLFDLLLDLILRMHTALHPLSLCAQQECDTVAVERKLVSSLQQTFLTHQTTTFVYNPKSHLNLYIRADYWYATVTIFRCRQALSVALLLSPATILYSDPRDLNLLCGSQ